MATMNRQGAVTAGCATCDGAVSTFEWTAAGRPFGVVSLDYEDGPIRDRVRKRSDYRLYRCAGCGRGGLACIIQLREDSFPSEYARLVWFEPDVVPRIALPDGTPKEIVYEFREAEACMGARAYRAAAAMFRSALEKTLTAAGYKPSSSISLYTQIEAAAKDGMITQARKRRAHDEVRVLGNDVLHDDWKEIDESAAYMAGEYTQRVIEDFYDQRETVLQQLRERGRVPTEDRKP